MKQTAYVFQVQDFNLEATLDSGQVFGFTRTEGGRYSGVLFGKPILLWQEKEKLFALSGEKKNILEAKLRHYFNLEKDLEALYEILRADEKLKISLLHYQGLRLIRQDSWEALACFILSSNNNVKRIQQIVQKLCAYYQVKKDSTVMLFPTASQLAKTHEKVLRGLGLGYRAPFLLHTAQFVSVNPKCLDVIREADYAEAKKRVLAFPGIGEKVADCVLLYGFQKYEAFPVDVWILRVMRKLYFRNRSVSEKKVLEFAQKKWKGHAGYVQQFLFHAGKNGIL